MKIFVIAKPAAKKEYIEKIGENYFIVAVKEPPRQGRANTAIVKALAEHLNVPSFRICFISGFSSKNKVFEFL